MMIYGTHQHQVFHNHDDDDPDVMSQRKHKPPEIFLVMSRIAVAEFRDTCNSLKQPCNVLAPFFSYRIDWQ